MHPILFEWGPLSVKSFGLMAAIGFGAAMWWIHRQAGRERINPDLMLNLCFWLMISGLIGARLMFIITNLSYYLDFPSEIVKIWHGGLVWYGGILAATPVAFFYLRAKKLPLLRGVDILSQGTILGLGFGRIGCLLAGDDYGKVVESGAHWWTLTFTNPDALIARELLGLPLYPTQIIMSINAFLIFGILVLWRRYRRFEGEIFCGLFIIYSITRFLIEYLRGDIGRGFVVYPYLSTSQFIGIFTLLFGIGLYLYLYRRSHSVAHRGKRSK